jgi:hypothetical protein
MHKLISISILFILNQTQLYPSNNIQEGIHASPNARTHGSSSVLGVCVVRYNKLQRRTNATKTKLGSKLPTISKKASAH